MSTIAVDRPAVAALDPQTCFSSRIKRVWKSPFYSGLLMVVALALILLPVIYVGIVALAGYGVYYHAVNNLGIITAGHGRRGGVFLYIAPLAVGVILIAFMIKPLFARPPRREKRVSLVRKNDPLLFDFVDRLCEVVGAPKPRRIDVDCEVNAAAGFRHGIWSLFWPGDLVLTIGVPLIAGLSLRDFTGVLAHEFGHFAQGLGMRFGYVIISVNLWFARVVYKRDAWDEWLEANSHTENTWVNIIMLLARACVFLTRKILWVLMVIGHAISCGMSRQMEYDADLHEVRTTGSASFESTERRMLALNFAQSGVYRDLQASWRDGKLGDDLPALICLKSDPLPEPIRAKIDEILTTSRRGWFDTHPSSAARMRRAQRADEGGVFTAEGPASQLFTNFVGLCKSITLSHYQDILGPNVTPKNLISTADQTKRQSDARRSREAADRYFFGCASLRRPLPLDAHSENFKLAEESARSKLTTARKALEQHGQSIRARQQKFRTADDRLLQLAVIEVVIKAGVKVEPKEFGLTAATVEAIGSARTATERERRAAIDDLAKIEAVMRTRTECALRLLGAESVAKRVRGIERLQQRTRDVLASINAVGGVSGTLTKLHQGLPGMMAMGRLLSDDDTNEEYNRKALRLTEAQHTQLDALRSMLQPFQYPFAHAAGKITLARFAISEVPERRNFIGVIEASKEAIDAMDGLYVRLIGEIAQVCEAVEAALGLPPIQVAAIAQESVKPE